MIQHDVLHKVLNEIVGNLIVGIREASDQLKGGDVSFVFQGALLNNLSYQRKQLLLFHQLYVCIVVLDTDGKQFDNGIIMLVISHDHFLYLALLKDAAIFSEPSWEVDIKHTL